MKMNFMVVVGNTGEGGLGGLKGGGDSCCACWSRGMGVACNRYMLIIEIKTKKQQWAVFKRNKLKLSSM